MGNQGYCVLCTTTSLDTEKDSVRTMTKSYNVYVSVDRKC